MDRPSSCMNIIVVTGAIGSGKTTAIQNLLKKGERIFTSRTMPKFYHSNKNVEAYSIHNIFNKSVVAFGSYDRDEPNRQGSDTFLFAPKKETAAFMVDVLADNDFLIYDTYNLSPTIMVELASFEIPVHLLHVNTPYEQCMADKALRQQARQRWTAEDFARSHRLSLKNYEAATSLDNVVSFASASRLDAARWLAKTINNDSKGRATQSESNRPSVHARPQGHLEEGSDHSSRTGETRREQQ